MAGLLSTFIARREELRVSSQLQMDHGVQWRLGQKRERGE